VEGAGSHPPFGDSPMVAFGRRVASALLLPSKLCVSPHPPASRFQSQRADAMLHLREAGLAAVPTAASTSRTSLARFGRLDGQRTPVAVVRRVVFALAPFKGAGHRRYALLRSQEAIDWPISSGESS
jgi:hypothetical protein